MGGARRDISVPIMNPLFEAHRWTANLRILEIDEIKTVPHVPLSHPFVERLIGTTRREFLDHVLFWNVRDLERKLADFQAYYNTAHGIPRRRVLAPAMATVTGVFTVTTPVTVHHMGAASEAHHDVEERGKQQQREQTFHMAFPHRQPSGHRVTRMNSDAWVTSRESQPA